MGSRARAGGGETLGAGEGVDDEEEATRADEEDEVAAGGGEKGGAEGGQWGGDGLADHERAEAKNVGGFVGEGFEDERRVAEAEETKKRLHGRHVAAKAESERRQGTRRPSTSLIARSGS